MTRKTVFKILGGIAAAAVAIVALVFYLTSGVTGAADKFFDTARSGNIDNTYALTSAELKNVTSAEQLDRFISANRFDQVAETNWGSRSVKNSVGRVEGTVTLDDGGVVPLTMQLVKEDGEWKISLIELRDAGLKGGAGPETAQAAASNLPAESKVSALVWVHTRQLFDAARRDDYEFFKAAWAEGVNVANLAELGAPLRGENAAFDAMEHARPVIVNTAPLGGGGFETSGYFAASPYRYEFTYRYMPNGDDWELAGMEYDFTGGV